ncbi:zinc metalloprotease [Porphyrobacter algicida]|uniref:Zinc metalloprotease n=1 Tax=Qipengyuania algicida TaxID=1836209 RepID=A0A845APW7_9SPHN|nr:neutral zinc metallopeptidase [Qipengyuania algicida]MXP28988.1 zinc metalloprotease [Qipengyuania algicida]
MRLNPFNTDNIRVRSAGGGGRMPGGRVGGLGLGTIVIAAIGYFVFGLDPSQTIGVVEQGRQGAQTQQQATSPQDEQALCTANKYATETCNALQSLNQTWQAVFEQQGVGQRFRQPELAFEPNTSFSTGCGPGSPDMGPFYCPADETIYIGTQFYDQLANQLGAPGEFARYYVVAHEYGHHIQALTGVAEAVARAKQRDPRNANRYQVAMELQADCYAGVWAGKNRHLIEPGDIESGMRAASQIGDDTLTQGRVSPDNFTHGTSAQRSAALKLGLQGDDRKCDAILDQA